MRRVSGEGAGAAGGFGEVAQVLAAGDFKGSELAEVGGDPLGIEKGEAAIAQALDEGVEGDFRGIGFAMEHGLAEEGAADGDAVEAAGKAVVAPGLDGMGEAATVKLAIALDDLLGDPGFVAAGAGAHDGFEGLIDAEIEEAALERALEAMGDVEGFVEWDDGARVRGEPADLAVVHAHREDAVKVALDEERGGDHWGGNLGVC